MHSTIKAGYGGAPSTLFICRALPRHRENLEGLTGCCWLWQDLVLFSTPGAVRNGRPIVLYRLEPGQEPPGFDGNFYPTTVNLPGLKAGASRLMDGHMVRRDADPWTSHLPGR